ncbi:hypothetical protein [Microbacterium sp. gxy059]
MPHLLGTLITVGTWVVLFAAAWFVIRTAVLSALRAHEREKRAPPV